MNANDWYVETANGRLGPLSTSDLRVAFSERRIKWTDLAIRAGHDSSWKMLFEVAELNELREFPQTDSSWIIRHGQFAMFGPLSIDQVRDGIAKGAISYADLAWHTSGNQWRRLGDLPEFGAVTALPESTFSGQIQEVPSEELLAQVARSGEIAMRDTVPDEADGIDLVGELPWMKTLSALVFVLAFGFRPPLLWAASILEIVPLKLSTPAPHLTFQTDAAPGEVIQVEIYGASGEILELPSFRQQLKVSRGAGEVPTLNLSALKLPPGTYKVSASVGAIQKSTTIFIGLKDDEFERARAQHIKAISAQQQSEKMTLFYALKKLVGLSKRLRKGLQGDADADWKKFYADFNQDLKSARQPIDALISEGEKRLAYPVQMAALRDAVERLKSLANERNQSSGVNSRGIASVGGSPAELVKELEVLRKQAATLTSAAP